MGDFGSKHIYLISDCMIISWATVVVQGEVTLIKFALRAGLFIKLGV